MARKDVCCCQIDAESGITRSRIIQDGGSGLWNTFKENNETECFGLFKQNDCYENPVRNVMIKIVHTVKHRRRSYLPFLL
ncbi:hypothetical protein J6590_054347 [Homalodisca vitripennis]|nr:hypothetical protein J6590_054347 [Homalodisca vitripennis]